MEREVVGLLGLGVLLLLMAVGAPLGFAFMLVGFLGALYLVGLGPGLSALALVSYTWSASYILMAIPLFVLMGYFSLHSGIAEELFLAAQKWLGRLPGGLGIATTFAAGGFAATCGSSIATAGAMGAVALPQMRKAGYDAGFAAGCVAAGGTLGILIPPSITFIVYGAIAEESVGKLFLAGYLPGMLEITMYSLLILALCRFRPGIAPRGISFPWKERLIALRGMVMMILLIVLVMGGIFAGVFTPTEAGAIGALGALLIAFFKRRLNSQNLRLSLMEASVVTAMLFILIIGSMVFSYFMAISGLAQAMGAWVVGLGLSRLGFLALVLFIMIILGCVMPPAVIVVLVVPLLLVPLKAYDISLIWFGVLTVRMVEIAEITPPVGMNVFVLKGVAPDIPLETIFRGVFPFILADIVIVAFLVAFPWISLFLPNLMMK